MAASSSRGGITCGKRTFSAQTETILALALFSDEAKRTLIENIRADAVDNMLFAFPGDLSFGIKDLHKVVEAPIHAAAELADIEMVYLKALTRALTAGTVVFHPQYFNKNPVFIKVNITLSCHIFSR